jgi:hypothetical protein
VCDERARLRSSFTIMLMFMLMLKVMLCLDVVDRQHLLYAQNMIHVTQLYALLMPNA